MCPRTKALCSVTDRHCSFMISKPQKMRNGSLEHGNTFREQRGRKRRGRRVRKDYGSCQEIFSGQSQALSDLESHGSILTA